MPPLSWSYKQIAEFPGKFEEYYNDHFGLRDSLVFYQQLFSFKLFNVSSSDFVTVGRDEWLFFNGDGAMHAFMGLMPLSSVYLQSCRWTLQDRRDWLAEQGIKYLFLPVPNKESIYPEFLPRRIQRRAGKSLYDQIISSLEEQPGFAEYLDLKKTFLEKKHDKQLYFRTDSHWNYNGAFVAYRDIVSGLTLQGIPVAPLSAQDLNWRTTDFSGDLTVLLHMYNTLHEVAPLVEVEHPCPSAPHRAAAPVAAAAGLAGFADDPRHFVMVQGCVDSKSTVLVIHDSFGEFLKPFLSNSFAKVFYVKRGLSEIKDFIEWARPDVIIDQRVERNLLLALAPDRAIETVLLKKRFPQSDNLVFRLDRRSTEEDFTHLPTVAVEQRADGLLIKSEEQYPFLSFTYDPGPGAAPLMVRMSLTSSQETQWLLYYATEEFSDFLPAHTISMPVQKGYNEFFFRLPYPGTAGKLQFHPGVAPGEYVLHSFSIKREGRGQL